MGQIESFLERPKFYNNIDGVGELGIGVMLLGFGALTWLQVHSPAGALVHKVYVVVPLILLGAFVIDRGTRAIKDCITYPRTGYVECRKQDTRRLAAVSFVVAALAAFGITYAARAHWGAGTHAGLMTPAALLGLAFAAAYAYGVARAVRWKWAVAALIAVCSVAMAMLPPNWPGAMVGDAANAGPFAPNNVGAWLLSILVYGAITLLSGAASFVLYLRHTQPPAAEAE